VASLRRPPVGQRGLGRELSRAPARSPPLLSLHFKRRRSPSPENPSPSPTTASSSAHRPPHSAAAGKPLPDCLRVHHPLLLLAWSRPTAALPSARSLSPMRVSLRRRRSPPCRHSPPRRARLCHGRAPLPHRAARARATPAPFAPRPRRRTLAAARARSRGLHRGRAPVVPWRVKACAPVAEPPELFRFKCASYRHTADNDSTHFKRNNPLVCRVSARYNHGSTGSRQVYLT
jgi:hypothetical protein